MALALVAAPQLSFVHALSHISAAAATPADLRQAGEDRQQAPDKACDLCLTFAHLGQALGSTHAAPSFDGGSVAIGQVLVARGDQRAPSHFQARAPPSFL